jgi:hypothetical protein
VAQLAIAHPFASAPVRVGAHRKPLAHVSLGPHGVGLQRPEAASQLCAGGHDVAVHAATHWVPGVAMHPQGSAAGSQIRPAPQSPSVLHCCGSGRQAPQRPVT